MSLTVSYQKVRDSIIAFVPKYEPIWGKEAPPPPFPTIIGTGFIVKKDGLIATNRHVTDEFFNVFKPPEAESEWAVHACLLRLTPGGMAKVPLEVLGFYQAKFEIPENYYGSKQGPDISFVYVKARDLPALDIDKESEIIEGMEICTAGFPMGTDALMAPGYLHQISPTLQKGIVSCVLPFTCSTPHAYAVNMMTQGGASGSPVFLPDSGRIVGVLYGSLNDFRRTLNQKDIYTVPTNISYVVPSHYVSAALKQFDEEKVFELPKDAKPLDEIIEDGMKRFLARGRKPQIKQVG